MLAAMKLAPRFDHIRSWAGGPTRPMLAGGVVTGVIGLVALLALTAGPEVEAVAATMPAAPTPTVSTTTAEAPLPNVCERQTWPYLDKNCVVTNALSVERRVRIVSTDRVAGRPDYMATIAAPAVSRPDTPPKPVSEPVPAPTAPTRIIASTNEEAATIIAAAPASAQRTPPPSRRARRGEAVRQPTIYAVPREDGRGYVRVYVSRSAPQHF